MDWVPRYNVAPTQDAPVIFNQGEPDLQMMRWGLIPFWSRDETIGARMINARSETLQEKASFKRPFTRQRCLVLADGYYEWKKAVRGKIPYRFILEGGKPFAFAGLWDKWQPPDGTPVQSFTIITTEANIMARTVHDRMPVILAPENYELWLDPAQKDLARLQALLQPYPPKDMSCYPVSPIVNNARNDSPQCIEPVPEPGL